MSDTQTKFASNQFPQTSELARRIRLHALQMTSRGGSSHIGSILSIVDIVSVLYGQIAQLDPTHCGEQVVGGGRFKRLHPIMGSCPGRHVNCLAAGKG